MPKRIPFEKPALSLDNQIALLKGRGLEIGDEARAKHYLRLIGYFRLAAYARHLRDRTGQDPERYLPGATFDRALDLYIFDRKLRILLLDALERIEVAVKSVMSNKIGVSRGAFWLSDANNFDRGKHQSVIFEILKWSAMTLPLTSISSSHISIESIPTPILHAGC